MSRNNIIEKLRNDEHYYGEFGKLYLSNSDISTLLKDPLALGKPSKQIPAFLIGGYFHTAILTKHTQPVSYTHLTLPTIYSV